MPGRMESVENLVAAAVPGSRNRGWFSTLPTAPWKSLRDSHSSTAPTMTILSYHQGDTSTGLPKGTFLLGLDIQREKTWYSGQRGCILSPCQGQNGNLGDDMGLKTCRSARAPFRSGSQIAVLTRSSRAAPLLQLRFSGDPAGDCRYGKYRNSVQQYRSCRPRHS